MSEKVIQFRHPLLKERKGSKRSKGIKRGIGFEEDAARRSTIRADVMTLVLWEKKESLPESASRAEILPGKICRDAFKLFYKPFYGSRWEAEWTRYAARHTPDDSRAKLMSVSRDSEKTIASLVRSLRGFNRKIGHLLRASNYLSGNCLTKNDWIYAAETNKSLYETWDATYECIIALGAQPYNDVAVYEER